MTFPPEDKRPRWLTGLQKSIIIETAVILSVRAALECAPCAACRPWEECLDRAPSTWAPNHIAETVSRRPRSPKPRKTKTRSGAKWLFNVEKHPGIRFTAAGPYLATKSERFSSRSRVLPAVLFICSKGGLETGLPCPISSVVFLLLPGFSMLLVGE